jgi:single-stranded DNA-binding protein
MLNDLNSVLLYGHFSEKPYFRSSPDKLLFCSFHLISQKLYPHKKLNIFDITTKGKIADYIAKNISTDTPIRVLGRLKEFRWKDEQGKPRSRIAVDAEYIEKNNSLQSAGKEDYNSVLLEGKLVKDPEYLDMPDNNHFCNLYMSSLQNISLGGKGDDSIIDQDSNIFMVKLTSEQAENIRNKRLSKGDIIRVVGSLESEELTKQSSRIYISPERIDAKRAAKYVLLDITDKPETGKLPPKPAYRRDSYSISD